MKVKFTEEDWKVLEKICSKDPAVYCIAMYKIAAVRAGFPPAFMLDLGRKYNPSGFVVTEAFEKRLRDVIAKVSKHEVHPFTWINCSPSTLKVVGLLDDEINVEETKCFL